MDYYCCHLHLCTHGLLFCIYGLFLKFFFTVCTAPLFSYSAILIATSEQINLLSLLSLSNQKYILQKSKCYGTAADEVTKCFVFKTAP